jgi:4'-phosphopantetheinyl transferase
VTPSILRKPLSDERSVNAAAILKEPSFVRALMPEPGRDACAIWWATPDAAAGSELADLLAVGEREKWARLRVDRDQRAYLAAHALVRIVVGSLLNVSPRDVPFAAACPHCGGVDHGKPQIPGADLELSITHSQGRVGVAVTHAVPVGLDAEDEVAGRPVGSLARGALSEHERATLALLPEHRRRSGLLRYWTRKEAVLKATGYGLAVPPVAVTVSGPNEPPHLLAWPPGLPLGAAVYLHDVSPGPGHLGAVALLGSHLPVTEHDASPLLATAFHWHSGNASEQRHLADEATALPSPPVRVISTRALRSHTIT